MTASSSFDAAHDGLPGTPPRQRRIWPYIVAGIAAICTMTGAVLVVGGVLVFRRHVQSQTISPESAAAEFTRIADRYATSVPLIELRGRGERAIMHRTPERPRQHIDSLRLLIYDTNNQRLMRITVPGWLLRLAPRSNGHRSIRIDGIHGLDGSGESAITLEDLERHGPGLIIDGRNRRDDNRLLAWVE